MIPLALAVLQAASPVTVTFETDDGVTVFGDLYEAAVEHPEDQRPSWAERTTIPVFMTWSPDEIDAERRARFARVASPDKTLYEQTHGVHGASTLRPDRNPDGSAANHEALIAFLRRYLERRDRERR
jgi:hypothetical protein